MTYSQSAPCPCGATAWADRPTPQTGAGRPPLALTYCPACRQNRNRARKTANQRHWRQRQGEA